MSDSTERQYEFKTEVQELLHLIVHTLYQHKEVFLRELLSNAADALSKIQFETLTNPDVYDKDQPLEITIKVDKEKRFISITDTGVGMTEAELIEQIGTIAHSGTRSFMEKMKEQKGGKQMGDLIGQFGVGFYSVFMVSDRVSIETRSYHADAPAVRWESDGKGTYTLQPSSRRRRGTTITAHLTEDHKEFLEDYRIKSLVREYSNFLPFPIMMGEERLNQSEALWRMPKNEIKDEQYKDFFQQVGGGFGEPLHWEHIMSEAPVQFSAVVYIPKTSPLEYVGKPLEHGLKLYAKRVFIQDNCKPLLPQYLRFVKGVVDSEDIALNVSRETIQSDVHIVKINKAITKRVLNALKKMAEEDETKYLEFWKTHGRFIKEGVHSEFGKRDQLLPLLRFHSTQQTEEPKVSLKDYVERKVEGQKAIYYAIGESLEQLRRSPHLEFFQKHNMEVLLATDPVDDLVLTSLEPYQEMKFVNVEGGDLELPDSLKKELEDYKPPKELEKLATKVRSVLQDKVSKVRFSRTLSDSPCRFYSEEGGISHSVRKMMMNMEGLNNIPMKRDLELNPDHAFVNGLAGNLSADDIDDRIHLLYHMASLLEGEAEDPQELARLIMPFLQSK